MEILDEVSVSAVLVVCVRVQLDRGLEDRVAVAGFVGTVDVLGSGDSDTMAFVRAAFCDEKVVVSIASVDVRTLGDDASVAGPKDSFCCKFFACLDVDLEAGDAA